MILCLIRGIRRDYVLDQGEWVGIPTNKDREKQQSRKKSIPSVYQESTVMKTKESRKPIQQENGTL